jgi:GntR family transcriptional regulator
MHMKLDKSSPVPLYHQLKDIISKMIESSYHPGDLLPAEPEMERMFGVSRMTVRLAMNALMEEGLVDKQRGRGTFVRSPKITHNLMAISSWTEQMLERGLQPRTVETEIALMEPPKKIAMLLHTAEGEKVIRIRRVRYANEEPMCIMINYLKESVAPGLDKRELSDDSLYGFLEKEYRVRFTKAQETVEAREASEYEAEKLHIQAWSPVLFVTRLSYLPDGNPAEVVHLTSRADRYQYQITLHSSQ